MFRHVRPILIVLFAMLQCLAPFLHAHAGTIKHGGLHLPGMPEHVIKTASSHLCVDAGHAQPNAAIALSSSLEPRQPAMPPKVSGNPYPPPEPIHPIGVALEAKSLSARPPFLASWRTPLPIAPPRA